MIQQVQNTCLFHGLPGDDANLHIDKFLVITQHMKQNGVSDDALRLSLFSYSLTHHAIAWYDCLPRNSIHSFDDMMRKFLSKYFPPSMVTKLRNEITKFEQKSHELLFEAWERYKLSIDRCPNHNMLLVTQINTFYNGLTLSHWDTINAAAGRTFMQKTPKECYELIENMTAHRIHWDTLVIRDETSRNISSTSTTEIVSGYTQETAFATTGNYNSGAGPLAPLPPFKEVDREPETITDQVLTGSTNNIPPLVVQASPASTSSKMPEFLNNKEKLFDLATTPMNENCSAVILKKLPEKLGDLKKFLIPCDFLELDKCLALADLGASINLMPLSIWRKLCLPELTSMQMILELADRSTTRPVGIAEDVFVKVEKFHFPTDFVVVDYVVNPRVPLILERPFLRTRGALIDVYGEELTLRVDDEEITFKVGQTSKYSYNDAKLFNQLDVIDLACEKYVQEVLGFSNNSKSGSPTPTLDPIIFSYSISFTPFEGSDFILEEIETYLRTPDDLSNLDDDYYDTKGDIIYLEKLLNEDPPWVSPIHCVPKKGGMTVVENNDNELIPTRCMMAIFPDMIEKTIDVFMDNFSVLSDSFSSCLSPLDKMLQRCEDTNLVLNWEKCHYMVKEGIVLGHKISKSEIEVDRSKVDVIAKLPHPNSVKGV
nr:reverse transcriptase domain-containing protein [Tanacetum cinerariifolium]